jgi:hypothetical protein
VVNDSVRIHEAAHCAAALWFGGRPVKRVRVDNPEVDINGKVETSIEREFGPEDLIINLLGWMADPQEREGGWPPSWPRITTRPTASASSSSVSSWMRRATAAASPRPRSC